MNEDLLARTAEACRVLGRLDATHTTFGHVSARDGHDAMLIRGKGPGETGLRYTENNDIIGVSFDVEKLGGREELRPPSESFLHAWLYKLRPEVESVIHMHPESALLLTICGRELVPIYGGYGKGAGLAAEGVPTYDSSLTINSHERGRDFAKFMAAKRACLMRGHGVAVVGSSIEEAAVTMMTLNELADITYQAHLLGDPRPLPQSEVDEVGEPPSPDRPFGSAGGQEGVMSMWRFYRTLADER